MHTVVETRAYLMAAASARMTDEERNAIVSLLAAEPEHGVRPAGWGGARKFRWARASGGYRVVTAYCGEDTPVFLVTVFAKGEKDNLTRAEGQQLAVLVKQLCTSYAGRRRP